MSQSDNDLLASSSSDLQSSIKPVSAQTQQQINQLVHQAKQKRELVDPRKVPELPVSIAFDAAHSLTNGTGRKPLDLSFREKIEPYAFIRVSNEAITLRTSLQSIVQVIRRGIICTHELPPGVEDDGTEEIILDFIAQNPGFRWVKYPLPVLPHNHPYTLANLQKPEFSRYWLLDVFYNYALLHLKELMHENGHDKNGGIIKIDGDHVYNDHVLAMAFNQIASKVDANGYSNKVFLCTKYNILSDLTPILQEGLSETQVAAHKLNKKNLGRGFPVNAGFKCVRVQVHAEDHYICHYHTLRTHAYQIKYNADGTVSHFEVVKFAENYEFDAEESFLTSIHFFAEKLYQYRLDWYSQVESNSFIYQGIDVPEDGKLTGLVTYSNSSVEADADFGRLDNVKAIRNSFFYPNPVNKTYKQYSQEAINFKELEANQKYKMDTWLAGFNLKLNAIEMYKDEKEEIELEARVLRPLFATHIREVELVDLRPKASS